ncbi:Ribonuclease H-like superfamily [Arabidopsis thaliana x Arabidopsis arenosa]|uniref:Ribonuclease H-like superfamily n=1 Tax=Arabidopsis thaliana x Arabidopsis arenosa TaxID=1240361 RepID=A0A8T1Y6Z0_9BRAS|nr:Ribonuclease H-like superfamily [Arabidopsis thaliana x Arabidopsis arenosa]
MRICQGLGFDNSFRVDAVGQSGGLWLLWRTEIGDVTIIDSTDQYIHARVVTGEEVMHLIAVYCRDGVVGMEVEVTAANLSINEGGRAGPVRVVRQIAWTPPGEGWMKLNTDGASHGNPGLATAGGVLRDIDGNWCGGFAVNIGLCSAPLAELWGVYYGLFIAWDRGARRVELEVDSEIVVGFLKTGINDTHPLSFLVRLCYGFITKDWIVRISHVYREANRLADGLANYAFSLPLGFHLLEAPPECVSSILFEDSIGLSHPRNVRL